MRDIKKLIESDQSVTKIQEAVLNEVRGLFDLGEKDFVIDLLNQQKEVSMKASRGNIQKFELEYIKKMLYTFLRATKDKNSPTYNMAAQIKNKIESIWDNKQMLSKSSEGYRVKKEKRLKSDNSGPYATTGSSVTRYWIQQPKGLGVGDWGLIKAWAEKKGNIAGRNSMVSDKIIYHNRWGLKGWVIDVQTTVYYN